MMMEEQERLKEALIRVKGELEANSLIQAEFKILNDCISRLEDTISKLDARLTPVKNQNMAYPAQEKRGMPEGAGSPFGKEIRAASSEIELLSENVQAIIATLEI